MQTFEYLRPATVGEACEMKADLLSEARFIAGGTDLMLEWRRGAVALSHVIDLSFVAGMRASSVTSRELHLGATLTLGDLAAADGDEWWARVLASAASRMATPQLRTLATVGGNVCHASPCADMAVLLTALDAVLAVAATRGARTLAAGDFFVGVNQTALADDEMVAWIGVPLPVASTAAAYQRVARTSVDLAQASAAVRLSSEDGHSVSDARVVIGACSPTPARSREAEQVLLGLSLTAPDEKTLAEAGHLAQRATSPISDVRCAEEYRREVSKVLVRRAVLQAAAELARNADSAVQGHGGTEA
jgi:carbon-monoxide dehydrogenase medium subunit